MKQIPAKRWLLRLLALVLAILTLLSAIAYVIDPYFQFRFSAPNHYYVNDATRFGPGLVMHAPYDTLLVGSSMTQNFIVEHLASTLHCEPLRIGIGGIGFVEINELLQLAYQAGQAKAFYICVDLPLFSNSSGKMKESRIPGYLSHSDLLSHLRYLLSFEVWAGYLPVDVGFLLCDKLGISLPPEIEGKKNIDWMEYWGDQFVYGENVVLDVYESSRYDVSDVDTTDLLDRMTHNIDIFFSGLDFTAGQHIFFFPPYSALFWCNAQDRGYFEEYLEAKEYFIHKALAAGATVFDFQSDKLSMDLNNYKDTTHFSPAVNDWETEQFAESKYLVTEDNREELEQKLRENTERFRREHKEWF